MHHRRLAALAGSASLVLLLTACGSDGTAVGPESDDRVAGTPGNPDADGAPGSTGDPGKGGPSPESGDPGGDAGDDAGDGAEAACPNCAFEPKLYVRARGAPVTETVAFEGHPDGAYVLETDDLGTRGAASRLWLDGEPLEVPDGLHRRDVSLVEANTLESRLTGKPGSKLRVRVFQEVASVEVTPAVASARIPATQQLTAVAQDRNGVEIPRQTFTWASRDTALATVGVGSGLARTVGETHGDEAFSYWTHGLGEGTARIVARPDGTPDVEGAAEWTVAHGYVYTTHRAPPPPGFRRITLSRPFSYDERRLNRMAATCDREASDVEWWPHPTIDRRERRFQRCYPSLERTTRSRRKGTDRNGVPVSVNVGLYGRYCGGGHPDGDFFADASSGNYQPVDPVDALCMEHDKSEDHHEIPASNVPKAACIVRYGIESEELHFEGERVPEGSARWDAFWERWPDMARARRNWIVETTVTCAGPIYDRFLEERELERP